MKPFIFTLFSLLSLGGFGQNTQHTQSRTLSNFSGLSLNVPAQVSLSAGDYSFQITCSQELMDKIITKVNSGMLEISIDQDNQNHDLGKIEIQLSMPALDHLEVNGSGKVMSEGGFLGNTLALLINGSGAINIKNIHYDQMDACINGSGNFSGLSGKVNNATIEINGSGMADAGALDAQDMTSTVAGSGSMLLQVNGTLKAHVMGSGNIRYKGKPAYLKKDIDGSGSIHSIN